MARVQRPKKKQKDPQTCTKKPHIDPREVAMASMTTQLQPKESTLIFAEFGEALHRGDSLKLLGCFFFLGLPAGLSKTSNTLVQTELEP